VADPRRGLSRRRLPIALVALGALVLLGHAGLLGWLGARLSRPAEPAMERLSALYTRQLTQSAPPGAAFPRSAAAPKVARPRQATPARPPVAEAPSAPSSAVVPDPVEAAASGPAPEAVSAPASLAEASPPPVMAEASAPGPAFEWPASTRLRYALTGWYQGEVHGEAQVEWLRQGERYQVHLEVVIGPSLAPLMSRRMSSEGRITPEGLRPQRYEQETRQIVGRDRRAQMLFEDDGVLLPEGRRMPARADVQDSASQFIQMVWLFATRPELRQTGTRVEFDLALPHRVRRWVYEVGEKVPVHTPLGPVETLHVRPVPITTALPEAAAEAVRRGGSLLSAQIWYAPTLQMLPVRIRLEQDAQTWVDLMLSEVPQQAGSPAAKK